MSFSVSQVVKPSGKKRSQVWSGVPSHLYECISGSVVGDGEAQSIFRFEHLHLLFDPFNVGKDEVLQTNLAPQQLLHVNLVGVESAEHDLNRDKKKSKILANMFSHEQ